MNNKLYSSFILLLLALSFVSAALVTEYPGYGDNVEFRDNSNEALEQTVSGSFGTYSAKLFKYDGSLTINAVIILYVLLIMVFFVLLDIIRAVPVLQRPFLPVVLAGIISILISLSGSYTVVTGMFMDLAGRLTEVVVLGLAIIVIIIVAATLIIGYTFRKIKSWQNKEDAGETGFKLGSETEMIKMYAKMPKD